MLGFSAPPARHENKFINTTRVIRLPRVFQSAN